MEPVNTESANNLLVAVAQAHVQYHVANPTKVYIKKSTKRVVIRTQFEGQTSGARRPVMTTNSGRSIGQSVITGLHSCGAG